MALAQWNIPPPMVADLTLADFEQLTAAVDAETRAGQQRAARDGR